MSFKAISLVLCAVMVVKAVVALAAPERFYAARRQQYGHAVLPSGLLIAPLLVLGMTVAAWHATLFHYRPWSWLVTGFLTLLSVMSLHHLLCWTQHRQRMLRLLDSPRLRWIDTGILLLGLAFGLLGALVF